MDDIILYCIRVISFGSSQKALEERNEFISVLVILRKSLVDDISKQVEMRAVCYGKVYGAPRVNPLKVNSKKTFANFLCVNYEISCLA